VFLALVLTTTMATTTTTTAAAAETWMDTAKVLSDNTYAITFLNNTQVQTYATLLECKGFAQRLFHLPSDRYCYTCKFYPAPLTRLVLINLWLPLAPFCVCVYSLRHYLFYFCASPGRLPGPVKDLYKHAR